MSVLCFLSHISSLCFAYNTSVLEGSGSHGAPNHMKPRIRDSMRDCDEDFGFQLVGISDSSRALPKVLFYFFEVIK